jgi:hypothetical protein
MYAPDPASCNKALPDGLWFSLVAGTEPYNNIKKDLLHDLQSRSLA